MRMLLVVALLLGTSPALAAQSPEDAYSACLIGNAVLANSADGLSATDAFDRAAAICSTLASAVPEGEPTEEGSTGAAAVEESVIHLLDNVIWAACPVSGTQV